MSAISVTFPAYRLLKTRSAVHPAACRKNAPPEQFAPRTATEHIAARRSDRAAIITVCGWERVSPDQCIAKQTRMGMAFMAVDGEIDGLDRWRIDRNHRHDLPECGKGSGIDRHSTIDIFRLCTNIFLARNNALGMAFMTMKHSTIQTRQNVLLLKTSLCLIIIYNHIENMTKK